MERRNEKVKGTISRRKKSKIRGKKKRKRMTRRRKILEKRIENLKWINERKERDDRKNRIVIKV